MDVNGSRYHLLLGESDWLPGRSPITASVWQGLDWDAAAQALSLERLLFTFPTPGGDRPPSLSDRRGAAADRFGNWYWISSDRSEIRVQSVGDGLTGHFWSASDAACPPPRSTPTFEDAPGSVAPPTPLSLSGLAVTDDHYLVVGTREPSGLLVFDLRGGGSPVRSVWPAGVPFAPFDICRRKDGGVWILDRDPDGNKRRLWALDHTLAVIPLGLPDVLSERSDFEPVGTTAEPPSSTPRPQISAGAALPLDDDAIAIDITADGTLLVLLHDGPLLSSRLLRLGGDGQPLGPAAPLEDDALEGSLVGHDLAVWETHVYVVDARGNQTYAFELLLGGLQLARAFFPMRLFGGKALATGPNGPCYDVGDAFVPLVEQHRPRFEHKGFLETRVFDGHEPGCVWHRMILDAWIPGGASVLVESRASDDEKKLASTAWLREPDPLERASGPELPFLRLRPEGAPTSFELLFQAARGRYLQLRLRLEGDGRVTPRLRALRVWYPRFSYLERHLPKLYREEPESASFLDRYLANPEGLLTSLEGSIASSQVLLDPRTAQRETLDWIATFFDVALDPSWSEARRRLFLRHATDFFSRRGAIRGLLLALDLAFDDCADESLFDDGDPATMHSARIVERFRVRTTPAVVLGDPTADDGPRLVSATLDRWTPDDGGDELNRRFADYVAVRGARFPLNPAEAPSLALWERFAADVLGFVPAANASHTGAWHDFLRRRYRTIDALNSDYGTFGTGRHLDFRSVPLPARVPGDGAPLADWYQFETIILPTRRFAHRFTVLLPVDPGSTNQDHDQRKALAERIIRLQKPAHTVFNVRFYWSAFRVGEARLGYDTLIASGSRSPALLGAAVLGHSSLGESSLAGHRPTPLPAPIRQEMP